MAKPGDLSSKKVKNSYKAIMQHDGASSKLYDGTGSMINSIDVTRITASKASIGNISDLNHLSASNVQVDNHFSVSGSTTLGDNCGTDKVKVHGNTFVTGAFTVSGSCQGSFRSIGQAKFIYLDNPSIEDQKPARVTRGMVRGLYNVPRFGGENAALDVYGNAVITGSLIVTDTVFAQEFHSEHVSSSIIYTSGSTKFGGDFSDTMTVTGSIFQTGSDSYFLNGIGIGTTGSLKGGTFNDPGQDNPVRFTHLLRIDDPGHDGLQYKNSKLIYGSFGSTGASHVSASDVVKFRDKAKSDDVFVISSVSQSVFFTTNDKYNIGIAVPSGSNSKVDENLVVSSSTNSRIKIESANKTTSASLYVESGRSRWEIATVSASTHKKDQVSGSLVFRTQGNVSSNDLWTGRATYNEALRLDKNAKAGFNIPSVNAYQYPQQVQISGSLNIIQGRTIDIHAGTFHDSDGINGIYFNNQKMIYVSGSGASSNYFFGVSAGNSGTATTALSNIGIGYRTGLALTTGDYNILLGHDAGMSINSGLNNIILGHAAGDAMTNNQHNIVLGTRAFSSTAADANYNIVLGFDAMSAANTSGDENIAIGSLALQDATTGYNNIALGSSAMVNSTTAYGNIAIGKKALGVGTTTGHHNVAIGTEALEDATTASGSIVIGRGSAKNHTTAGGNIAIGSGSMGTGIATTGHHNIAMGHFAANDLTTGQKMLY